MTGQGPDNPEDKANRERELIERALGQASPRPDSWTFRGDLPPAGTFPGYELIREIHRGGQGAVYLAMQLATKRRVAIKVMHGGPFRGSSGRARFEREVQILGQLSHPNIVAIHDSGVTGDGSFFYVMDYVSGRSLDELITVDSRDRIDSTLKLFVKICEAVNAAHLRGVIHRDLKPANIRIDSEGEPVVVDFGLAKVAVPDTAGDGTPHPMTVTGQFVGSLPWASPEQAEGIPDKVDVRTDVYSLGVILYQMLTGKFPYQVVGNMRDVLDNILRAEPARPSTIRRQINDEVETIVLKCLAKERDRRYQTAGEIARDIQRYLAGQPIEAKRDSGWYVITKTLNRYRAPVAMALIALAALVIFAVVMSGLYRRAVSAESSLRLSLEEQTQAKDRAEKALRDLVAARKAEEEARARTEAVATEALTPARRMIDDLHDGVANLVGATSVRMSILRAGEEYLARLRERAGDRPELLREVAEVHERLGDILGGLYMRKLGKTDEATDHFAQARAIREKLAAAAPGDVRIRAELAWSIRREAGVLLLRRKAAEAREQFETALAGLDAALAAAGSGDPGRRLLEERRAQTLASIGDALALMSEDAKTPADARDLLDRASARYDGAEAYWSGRMRADASDAAAARWLGVCRDQRAATLIAMGAQRRRAKDWNGAEDRFNRAGEVAAQAASEFQALGAARPQDAVLKRDLVLALLNQGWASAELGEVAKLRAGDGAEGVIEERRRLHTNAMQIYARAMEIALGLVSADEDNLEAQRDVALCLNKLGNEHRELAELGEPERFADAAAIFSRSLEVREKLFRADPIQPHRRDLAVGLSKVAETADKWSATAADPQVRAERLRAAISGYERSLEEFNKLVAEGVMSGEAPFLKQIADAAADCRGRLQAIEQGGP